MSESKKVLIDWPAEHVALVTLNRPEARNAIDGETAAALEAAIDQLEEDDTARAVILTGSGEGVFSAGADLKEISRGNIAKLSTPRGGFAGIVNRTRTKPWIAAVNGLALAGGCEIALSCDLIIADENGAFALPEVKRGLIAGAGGVYRLPRALPRAIALEMILTGERMSAKTLAAHGMINATAPADQLIPRALDLASIISGNAPLAVRESLAIARNTLDHDEMSLQRMSDDAQERLSLTEDFKEGPLAFIEKRAPRWKGR